MTFGLPTFASAAPWIGAWTSAQTPDGPQNLLDPIPLRDVTLREVVHTSAGGDRFRIRLSNAFGKTELTIDDAHIAQAVAPGSPEIVIPSDRKLTFGGQDHAVIPAGKEIWSDPVAFSASAFADLAISLHVAVPADGETGHGDTQATSFQAPGDQSGAPRLTGAAPISHWYHLSAIAVEAEPAARSIVALGDSITDSYMSHVDGNDRWPDLLAKRLHQEAGLRNPAVLNEGIAGNRVLSNIVGPSLLSRLDRDLFSLPGAGSVILLEGVNDIGSLTREHPVSMPEHQAFVARMIAAYRSIVTQVHAHRMTIIGGTIMPFAQSGYYHPDAANEADRQAINAWIRAPGHFDGVIDFDQVTRDPQQPDRLLAVYDSGDHIHPSPAGYQAMAAAIPLDLLLRR